MLADETDAGKPESQKRQRQGKIPAFAMEIGGALLNVSSGV